MKVVVKILKAVFYLSLAIWIATSIFTAPLPDKEQIAEITKTSEPIQQEVKAEAIIKNYDKVDYNIKPKYEYEIVGLVVTQHNTKSFTDVSHEYDPGNTKDICLVWGENITNGSYQEVTYYSGDFTCFIKWDHQLNQPFLLNKLSNNHILPANEQIKRQINTVKIGDQIKLKGKLADYTVVDKAGNQLFTRPTSTIREDTGNGACEVLYVEEFERIGHGNPTFYGLKTASSWTTLGLGAFLTGKFLLGR